MTSVSLLAKSPLDAKIAEIVGPTIEDMGYRLVRVRLMSGRRPTLQLMAERPDGAMDVDDCTEVSHMVSALLDVEDPIDGEYTLEVSSPGIDRPLTHPQDFTRWSGWDAKLETYELQDGRKRFRGVLGGLNDAGEVLITLEDVGDVAVPFEALSDAKLVLTDALVAESLKGRAPGSNNAPTELSADEENNDGATSEQQNEA